jgi:hypothetical protein
VASPNTVAIVSAGTNYFFWDHSGTRTAYAGSGTPWTAVGTSPYTLSLNDQTPSWVPTPAPQMVLSSGGPPFMVGRQPLFIGYDVITEQVGVQLYASSKDNAIALLNQLRLILNTALFSLPALLSVKSGTNTGYCEIYRADVSELGSYIVEGTGAMWRAVITWTRAPFFSPSTLTTLQSGITVTNSGTGANNNTRTLGSPVGDLIYEGQPINVTIDTAQNARYFFLATVYQRTYNAGISGTTTTSSTTGAVAFNDATAGITDAARTRNGLRLRVMLRHTTISAKAQVQVQLVSPTSSQTLWRGPWVAPDTTGVGQIDATPQGVPLDIVRRALLETGDVNVGLLVRSNDGTSVSINMHSAEYLLYYTFCRIDTTTSVPANAFLTIEQAQNLNGTAYVPSPGSAYVAETSAGTDYLSDIADVRGTLPRAISGASLYFSWLSDSFVHTNTNTAAVTTTHLPLFRTARGGV